MRITCNRTGGLMILTRKSEIGLFKSRKRFGWIKATYDNGGWFLLAAAFNLAVYCRRS